jgi:thiamine biosynthesis protein ThiS
MTLLVNGERRDIPAGWTLSELLASVRLDPRLVVVERNQEIVRDRDTFGAIALRDGDSLELVHFVGGG